MVLYLIARSDQVKQKTLSVFAPWRFTQFNPGGLFNRGSITFFTFSTLLCKKNYLHFVERIKFVNFYGWMHF
jgi:hypothetical protein